MDARNLLTFVVRGLEDHYGPAHFDSQPSRFDPRRVGAFGGCYTDRHTQGVMIDGERFYISVEKDPNQ